MQCSVEGRCSNKSLSHQLTYLGRQECQTSVSTRSDMQGTLFWACDEGVLEDLFCR